MESSTALSSPATVLCVARNQTPGVLSDPHAFAHLLLCFSLASGLPSAPQGLCTCCPCCLEHSSPRAPLTRLLLTVRASAQWCPPRQPKPKSPDHRAPPCPDSCSWETVFYILHGTFFQKLPHWSLRIFIFHPTPGIFVSFTAMLRAWHTVDAQ